MRSIDDDDDGILDVRRHVFARKSKRHNVDLITVVLMILW